MTSYENSILRPHFERWESEARPPAWSSSRDALAACTPEWFNNRQGGLNTTGANTANPDHRGVYIDGYAGAQAYMYDEVVITHLNSEKSAIRVATTGTEDGTNIFSGCKAAVATMEARRLVGVVIGRAASTSEITFFPVRIPDGGYCWVLGRFFIVDIWPQTVYARDSVGVHKVMI